jgi:cysteine synthase A
METRHPALGAIGNTPVVQLQRVVPARSARVLIKLESANPTGSMKDRVARAMVQAALDGGRLKPGGTVVEYTGGTTGVSLAYVCAALGLRSHFVSSDAFSAEKLRTIRAFGGELTLIPSDGKRITRELIQSMMAKAKALSQQPGHWLCDQLGNRDGEAGYHALGDELWTQAGGRIDAFVQSVGSAHSLQGTAAALRRHNGAVQIVAAEPSESPILSGGSPGAHRIEGIGIGFVPPLWRGHEVSEVQSAGTEESNQMARRLAREEGVFTGTSSGLNVIAALRVAARLGPDATVATLAIDSGLRYLSTDVFEP